MEKYFDQLNILKGKEITSGVKKAVLNVFLKTVIMLMNFYHHISKRRTSMCRFKFFCHNSVMAFTLLVSGALK